MIKNILTVFTTQLDEYLSRFHHQPEGLAEMGVIGNGTEALPGKMVVSLINVEQGIVGGISGCSSNSNTLPPLRADLNVMLAAVYENKRYAESLSVLSDTLKFIQTIPFLEVEGELYKVDIISASTQDQNNMQALLGGKYYPSVICKIRGLVIKS